MDKREELMGLAERVEALSGPDREVDCAIGVTLGWFHTEPNKGWPDELDYVDIRDPENTRYPGNGGDWMVPTFTAFLDAAMSLVPEGAFGGEIRWDAGGARAVVGFGGIPESQQGYAATPALALTAACLRALAETAQ